MESSEQQTTTQRAARMAGRSTPVLRPRPECTHAGSTGTFSWAASIGYSAKCAAPPVSLPAANGMQGVPPGTSSRSSIRTPIHCRPRNSRQRHPATAVQGNRCPEQCRCGDHKPGQGLSNAPSVQAKRALKLMVTSLPLPMSCPPARPCLQLLRAAVVLRSSRARRGPQPGPPYPKPASTRNFRLPLSACLAKAGLKSQLSWLDAL